MLSKTLLLSALALTLTDGSSALAADSAHGRDTEAWIAGTMTPQALDALLKSALAAAPAGLAEAASVMTVDGAGQFDNSRPEAPPAGLAPGRLAKSRDGDAPCGHWLHLSIFEPPWLSS